MLHRCEGRLVQRHHLIFSALLVLRNHLTHGKNPRGSGASDVLGAAGGMGPVRVSEDSQVQAAVYCREIRYPGPALCEEVQNLRGGE